MNEQTVPSSTTTDFDKLRDYVEKWKAMNPPMNPPATNACPSCGYCPHCGRGGQRAYPSYPQWEPWRNPWAVTW